MEAVNWLVVVGIVMVFLGVLLVFLGVLVQALQGAGEGEAEAGGVIIIGPLPIIFGTSSKAALAAAILGLVMMLLALLLWWQARGMVG